MTFDSGSSLLKGMAVTAVAIVLLVPLSMLQSLVEERTEMRSQAVDSVAQGWGGRQLVGGPVLAIPVSWSDDEKKTVVRDWYLLPDTLSSEVAITVEREPRKLGVYEVPVYTARIHSTGSFDVARQLERFTATHAAAQIHLDQARLMMPVGDLRGVREIRMPDGQIAAGGLEPARGFPISVLAAPVRTDTPLGMGKQQFDVTLDLAGTESLSFLPLARSMRVSASGNWPHPGFTSGFLPVERHVDEKGFQARWQVLDLNRSYGALWLDNEISIEELQKSAFGITLVQPVDLYQQVTRAVKYAALFISLSLLTLFLVEHLLRRRLHPIQYGLIGLALSVFYLLLLALAEHIGFALAYLSAAAALCLLITVYLSGAFVSRRAGATAGGIFGAVYGLLYLLVTSEDYALLAGSLALFSLLATLMILTRRLDWYGSRVATE